MDVADQTMEIASFARMHGRPAEAWALHNVSFAHCRIEGPAVLLMVRTRMENSHFVGSTEGLLWIIEPGRTEFLGAIPMIDVSFDDCTFSRASRSIRARQTNNV